MVRIPSRPWFPWLALFALALGVRVLFFTALQGEPLGRLDFYFTTSDMYGNLVWVDQILKGDFLGRNPWHPYHPWMADIAPYETWVTWWGGATVFQQAPLYVYFLAALFKLCAGQPEGVRLFQHLLGALTVCLIALCGRRLYGRHAGWATGILAALYYPFFCYEYYFLRDSFAVFLLALWLVTLLESRSRPAGVYAATAGLLTALLILTRENFLLLAPLLPVWIAARGDPHRRHKMTWAALMLLAALSPLAVRNKMVGAPWYALSNRALESLVEGWAFDATPSYMSIPDTMGDLLHQGQGGLPASTRLVLQTYPDTRELLKRFLQKTLALFHVIEPYNNLNLYAYPDRIPWLRAFPGYAAILLMALPGFLLTWRKGNRWISAIFLVLALSLLMPPVLARYRLVLIPFYLMWAGAFVQWILPVDRHTRILTVLGLLAGVPLAENAIRARIPEIYRERDLEPFFEERIRSHPLPRGGPGDQE